MLHIHIYIYLYIWVHIHYNICIYIYIYAYPPWHPHSFLFFSTASRSQAHRLLLGRRCDGHRWWQTAKLAPLRWKAMRWTDHGILYSIDYPWFVVLSIGYQVHGIIVYVDLSIYHGIVLIYGLWISINQRKLGSNTSVLRTNRILRLEMMKGGARLRLDLDEGWCETLHDITIHHIETWPWWRVVWDFTWHNNTSHWDLTLMKGCVRLYMKGGVRVHEGWRREVVTKGSGDEGKWWRREVVTKGSGDDGKWWRREVVTKGSGDDGKWWRREVVTMGSGDEGKWWRREVVTKGSGDDGKWTKGSGDDGKWWRREVVTEGSGDDGKWWRREVMMKGSGDEGKWWRREVVTKGSGAHWNGCMGFVLGRKPEHETLCFSV